MDESRRTRIVKAANKQLRQIVAQRIMQSDKPLFGIYPSIGGKLGSFETITNLNNFVDIDDILDCMYWAERLDREGE